MARREDLQCLGVEKQRDDSKTSQSGPAGKIGMDGSAAAVNRKGVSVVIASMYFQHTVGSSVSKCHSSCVVFGT